MDTYVSDTFRALEEMEYINLQLHSDFSSSFRSPGERKIYISIVFERDNRVIRFGKYYDPGVTAGQALREAWEEFSRMLYASVPKADYTPATLAAPVEIDNDRPF